VDLRSKLESLRLLKAAAMTGRIWVLVVLILLTPRVLLAQGAPKANSLIVWEMNQSVQNIVRRIVAEGGRVDHVFPPNAAIGYIPSEKIDQLKARVVGLRVEQGTVEPGQRSLLGGGGAIAAAVWNSVFWNVPAPAPSRRREGPRRNPPNDARIAPDRLSSGPAQREAAPVASSAPGFFDTSSFFIGSVTVGIITPESSGAIDPDTENWDITRQNTVVSKTVEGLQWWKDNSNAPANITFVYDIHHSVPTSYEPISRSSADEGLWISQVMSNLGYPGAGYFSQVRTYLNDKRNAFGTDWALAIFVVDSVNDANGEFANGDFAYAYINGPFMVMTYDNDNWGINRMQIVAAHENGHIWGALDEYNLSNCTDTQTSGYLNIANTNCENGTPATEDSIMRNASNQEFQAYPNHRVSTPARQMVGWRDSDGDGKELYDPVDTTVTVALTPFSPDPTTDATPTYTGYGADIPFLSPTEPDVTINIITSIEWRVDGGPWQAATATNGAFDSDVEDFHFTPAALAPGLHTFEVRATNSGGNVSAIATDTLTILAIPSVAINDISILEGNSGTTNAVFTVTLSAASSQIVTVSYSTADGSATAGSDYAATSGIVTFNPGVTAKTITVLVNGDTIPEPNESFFVNLTSATNATIADGQGVGTIVNDDEPVSAPVAAAVDFDGDADTDVAVYEATTGNWFFVRSTLGIGSHPNFGAPNYLPVPGDYDGDGKTDTAVYDTTTGNWFINQSTEGFRIHPSFGGAGFIPVPGDYDGDGKTDVAVYETSTGHWFFVGSTTGFGQHLAFGGPNFVPVPGDYDGDGKTDTAVYDTNTGNWFINQSTAGFRIHPSFGGAGFIPVPGDYDGDGQIDVGVYQSSTGHWFAVGSTSGFMQHLAFGGSGFMPVPGDYDGDGMTDTAVYEQSTGNWFIAQSTAGFRIQPSFGGPGFAPVLPQVTILRALGLL